MKRLVLLAMLCLVNAVSVSGKTVVRVAAAANLRFVMEQIERRYEAECPGVDLQINYGASGNFYQQIRSGAPFNLFLSADDILPQKLKEDGLTHGECHTYACGKLALYGLREGVDKLGLRALDDKNIKRIALANPRTAPYGSRSVELLKAKGKWAELEKKIVYGESIAQAAQFATSGNAELGFVALSLLLNPTSKLKGSYYVIPQGDYAPIEQAGVMIKQKSPSPETEKFFNYILSDKCAKIWSEYGYSQR